MGMDKGTPVRCECGGHYYRDRNGRGVCEACKAVVTMDDLLRIGLHPVWDRNSGMRLKVMKREKDD